MSLTQAYEGRSCYLPDYESDFGSLFVAVPCQPGESLDITYALLDTAAEWCVLREEFAQDLGWRQTGAELETILETRFGPIAGRVTRLSIRFPAVEGAGITIEATCFVSPDWPGPLVIGWKGCLERMRFALDPGDESFYFAGP